MIFIALVWFLMGFVCYKIAAHKGLSKSIWTLLGVLFGVFTVLIMLLMPDKVDNR